MKKTIKKQAKPIKVEKIIKTLPRKFRLVEAEGSPQLLKAFDAVLKRGTRQKIPKLSRKIKGWEEYESALKETGIPSHLLVCKVSNEIGSGVFLRPDHPPIKKGDFIGIYTGELEVLPIDDVGENQVYAFDLLYKVKLTEGEIKALKKNLHDKHFKFRVNAWKKGNFACLINHSSDSNLEALLYQKNGTVVPLLRATKTINPGEQLLYDYGKGYWEFFKKKPAKMSPSTYVV